MGAAAGLARSSVYKYFSSGEEILTDPTEAFADWGARVSEAVGRAADADGRVDAYVRTTLELAGGAHRVAVLGGGLPPDAARERLRRRTATSPHRWSPRWPSAARRTPP